MQRQTNPSITTSRIRKTTNSGNGNRLLRNTVTGSRRYGIAVFSTPYRVQTPRPPWRPQANAIRGNAVRGSGAVSGQCTKAQQQHECGDSDVASPDAVHAYSPVL